MAEQHHNYTGILLLIFALAILLTAIFFTVAQTRVTSTDEYKSGNTKLQNAKNNLLIAYILGYIAAGISIVLAVLYFGHVTWGISSEIPHLILFILLFILVIVSGIFGFIALSNIDDSNISDKKGANNWIWAGLISALVGIVVLIISGAWRAQYTASKGVKTDTKAPAQMTFTSGMASPGYQAPGYQAPVLPPASSLPAVPPGSYKAEQSYTYAPMSPSPMGSASPMY